MKREELEKLEAKSWDRYRAASRNHLPALLKLWAAAEALQTAMEPPLGRTDLGKSATYNIGQLVAARTALGEALAELEAVK